MTAKVLLSSTDITRALARVAHEILERNHGADNLVLVGVRTRGVPLAERLRKAIEVFEHRAIPVGALDILAYRDDVGYELSCSHTGVRRPARVRVPVAVAGGFREATMPGDVLSDPPTTPPNLLPFSIEERKVVLVDDVLYTGRTIRAAMDALVDLGRPCSIQLAVLVDRGHRELPIRPDYVGKNIPSARNELVRVRLIETDGEDSVTIVERSAEGGGHE